MSRAWLGQVPIAGPWVRGPRLSAAEPQDLVCCVEPAEYGKQVKKCFDVSGGGCTLTWTSPPGNYPGVPACSNGRPAGCAPAPASVPLSPVTMPRPIPVENGNASPASFVAQKPMQARSIFANVQMTIEPPPCPEGPVPFQQWARACAAAKIQGNT